MGVEARAKAQYAKELSVVLKWNPDNRYQAVGLVAPKQVRKVNLREEASGVFVIPINGLRKAMHEITAKKGDFTLFALFRRANGLGGWDLVVAAPWLEAGRLKAIGEVIDLVTKSIGRWLQHLARVEVVPSDDPTVKLLASTPVEDGERRLVNTDLFGLQIEEAIILRAKRLGPKKASGEALTTAGAGSSRGRR